MLLLPDLSAAFDTVDHEILLKRLNSKFSICGTALNWFRSYLTNRTQVVLITVSWAQVWSTSRLRPWAHPLPTLHCSICRHSTIPWHGISFLRWWHSVIHFFSASNDLELTSSIAKIEEWISDLDKWMSLIKLKLNKDKTELLYLYSKHSPQQSLPPLSFGSDTIQPSPCSRNIGVVFDRTMSMLPRYFNRVTFLSLEPSIKNVSIRTNTRFLFL